MQQLANLTRRTLLQSGASAALGGLLAPAASASLPASAQPGLASLAAAKGMRFGSCVGAGPAGSQSGSYLNPDYAALVIRESNIIVPENELKWQAIRPAAKAFAFDRFDPMMQWAQDHALAVRAHTLLWHKTRWMPRWLETHDFGATPVKAAEKMLNTHVRTVLSVYGDRFASIDVVNEAVVAETGALEETRLSQALGGTMETLDLMFRAARAHAPNTELVYNDYMSWEPGNEAHRTGVLKLLEAFRKRGTPVDTLGVQSHIGAFELEPGTGRARRQELAWRHFLDDVSAMGYKLAITEFDVRDDAFPKDAAKRDSDVAAYAGDYLDMMFAYPTLKDVLIWGLVDPYSWLQGFMGPRKDGTPKRVTLYDDKFAAKPLRDTFARAFNNATSRI